MVIFMKNKWSILVVVCLLLGMLAGCGGGQEAASVSEDEKTSEIVAQEAVETEEEENVAASHEEPKTVQEDSSAVETAQVDLTISMPLTEDEVSFTLWHDFVPLLSNYMEGMQDNLSYSTMEEISGVHMEFTNVSKESAATAVSLLVASGDYPNIWYGFAGYYGQGIDTAIDAEIIYDLAQYKDLMPNYFAIVDGNEQYTKETYTDDGAMGLAYCLNSEQVIESGLVMRKDWLEELGMETPVTYEDFEDVLRAMHDAYGATLWLSYLGDDITKSFSAGFGITAFNLGSETYFQQVDGQVQFCPLEDGYLEYVTLMNRWYQDGLLYPDFMAGTSTTTCDPSLMANGTISMVSCPAGFIEQFYAVAEDENFELVASARPVKEAGDVIHQGSVVATTSTDGFSITTSISDDDPDFEILLKWLDYWYTQEGSDLANYGVEGVTYNRNEDGSVEFTDLMTNNPDGLAFNLCMNRYVLFVGSFVNDNTRTAVNYNDKQAESVEIWTENAGDGAYVYPTAISMTAEESEKFSSAYSDIATYVESQTLGFIAGSVPLSEYDSFCDTIRSMGIDDLIEIYQNCLDRYNGR